MSDTTVIVTEDSLHLVETPGGYGPPGKGLEFDVTGDQVGVRLQGETAYVYTDPLTGPAGSNDWADLDNVPAAFPPAPHSHAIGDTSGLQSALNAKQATSEKGAANGYAGLGADGKVLSAQLPEPGVDIPASASAVGSLVTAGSSALAEGSVHLPGVTVAGWSLHYSGNNDTFSSALSGHTSSNMQSNTNDAGVGFGYGGTWRLLSRVYQTDRWPVALWQRIA